MMLAHNINSNATNDRVYVDKEKHAINKCNNTIRSTTHVCYYLRRIYNKKVLAYGY